METKGLQGLQSYPLKKTLSHSGFSEEKGTSVACPSRQAVNAGHEVFKGKQVQDFQSIRGMATRSTLASVAGAGATPIQS